MIVKMKFGSHLYGTNTKQSDTDFKGIYMPSKREVFLNRVPKSLSNKTNSSTDKNTNEDIDTEIYSLHYFIHLACEGETVALDMLHAPKDMIVETSDIWGSLVFHREKFYTKNLKAFIGYARRQAAKYGIKGSRLNDAKRVIDFLSTVEAPVRLRDVWDELPEGEHIYKRPAVEFHNNLRVYEVCGKQLQESATASYVYDTIKLFHDAYGNRAKQAAENKGIDWKAVSHAIRAAVQVRQILVEKTIVFPLKEAPLLVKIKQGQMDYLTEVAPLLENLMSEVEVLSESSDLPSKVDRSFWDDFIVETVEAL